MLIIGKLVKKVLEIIYCRIKYCGLDFNVQKKVFCKLIKFVQDIEFGRKYGFFDMFDYLDMVMIFQYIVLIIDYDKFYEEWLYCLFDGEKNISWLGVVKYFVFFFGIIGFFFKCILVMW